MGLDNLKQKEVPYCAVCLVVATVICHACVLAGNMKTASAMHHLGQSTGGWSQVGLGLSRSFGGELDVMMENTSAMMISNLEELMLVQEGLDGALSMMGNSTDAAVANATTQAALMLHQRRAERQPGSGEAGAATAPSPLTDDFDALRPVLSGAVSTALEQAVDVAKDLIRNLVDRLRPVLEQVGAWLVKFGDQIQAGIQAFSSTLDTVQKLFDQVMAQVQGVNASAAEDLLRETYNLFDVSNTGSITLSDIVSVGEIYGIQALQGEKPAELFAQYDADDSGGVDRDEYALLVADESIPNVVSVILRTYARKLSEVAANTQRAEKRMDVAREVVHYFQLVCAKNQTKLEWVSDALGNGSLAADFTSAVLGQLCLQREDPNLLTTADVGQVVVSEVHRQHPSRLLEAVDLMSDTEWWVTNGFDPLTQPECMQVVTQWISNSESDSAQMVSGPGGVGPPNATPASLLAVMGDMARLEAEHNVRRYLHKRKKHHESRRAMLFASRSSELLFMQLLGGRTVAPASSLPTAAELAVSGGVQALPETLQFARWLSANATQTADRFQGYCFEYTSESSNSLDTFATQIQALVNKMSSFLSMMQEYSTPAGIARIEAQVVAFADSALEDVATVLNSTIGGLVVDSLVPTMGDLANDIVDQAGDAAADLVDGLLGPIGAAVTAPLEQAISGLLPGNSSGLAGIVGDTVGPMIGNLTANLTGELVETQLERILNDIIARLLASISQSLVGGVPAMSALQGYQPQPSTRGFGAAGLLALGQPDNASNASAPAAPVAGDSWGQMAGLLTTFTNLLPQGVDLMRDARTEVSKAAENMNSIFSGFHTKGPKIFDTVAKLYRILWGIYFAFLVPITLLVLFYALWAGGYFGGPKPFEEYKEDEREGPLTMWNRLSAVGRCCRSCWCENHDSHLCLWSFLIVMQIVVLVVFVVSIVLCIVAGVQALLTSGCAQVYMLGDSTVCADTLGNFRTFLESFHVVEGQLGEVFADTCASESLLTCQEISARMKDAVILTTIFSFVGAVLSLQLIIESALLHEKARFRRIVTKMVDDERMAVTQQQSFPRP